MSQPSRQEAEVWAGEYAKLLKTPLGEDLVKRLQAQHDSYVRSAKSATDPATAQMHLQRAVGVESAMSELLRLSTPPIDHKHKRVGQ